MNLVPVKPPYLAPIRAVWKRRANTPFPEADVRAALEQLLPAVASDVLADVAQELRRQARTPNTPVSKAGMERSAIDVAGILDRIANAYRTGARS